MTETGALARVAVLLAMAIAASFPSSFASAREKAARKEQVVSSEQVAKNLFGTEALPAAGTAQSYGFYSKGCLAGAMALPQYGPTWQVTRPSRNRAWGHPAMIGLIERLSRDAVAIGWRGLLIGDIAQPRGGPMLDGHASHQIGLDADIWLNPMPARRLSAAERDAIEPVSMLRKGTYVVDDRIWTPAHMKLLELAASYPEVERIFVNPGIKKKLCDTVTGDRSWLAKIRPNWGHDYHFHVRISCQPGSPDCKPQKEPPGDDGCGKPLDWWFNVGLKTPIAGPEVPRPRDTMTLDDLPKECRAVLAAPPASTAVASSGAGAAAPVMQTSTTESGTTVSAYAMGTAGSDEAARAFAKTPESGVPLPKPRPGN
jgi:penicillin-insensitive murein endopeptidase